MIRIAAVFLFIVAGIATYCLPIYAENKQELTQVYFNAKRTTDGHVEIKFVLSKSSNRAGKYEPAHGYTIRPNPEQKKCNIRKADNLDIDDQYKKKPLYDPSDLESRLPVDKIPTYFAMVVSAELSRRGLVTTKEEGYPYHVCTIQLWRKLLKDRYTQR